MTDQYEKFLHISHSTSPLKRRMLENMQLAGLAKSTRVNYLWQIERWQKKLGRPAATASEEEVRNYFVHAQQSCAKGTFKQICYALKWLYYRTLNRQWSLFENFRIALPPQKSLPKVFAEQDCQRIFQAIQHRTYRLCCRTIYATGMRVSEAVEFNIKQIDASQMIVRIVGKGKKERVVPLATPLLYALRRFWQTHQHPHFLFPRKNNENHIRADTMRWMLRKVGRQLNINNVMPHTFRHSFATRLLENGVPLHLVQAFMGHSSIKTTQIYLHVTKALQRKTQKSMNQIFANTFGAEGGNVK